MNESRKTHTMSVEEIIKSIKGIIDNSPNKHSTDTDNVLELTNVVEDVQEISYDNSDDAHELAAVDEGLTSPEAAKDTANLMKQFVQAAKIVTVENRRKKALTLEDMVIDMIKPELKKWLDENLPKLVQDLVEKEIKRLMTDE